MITYYIYKLTSPSGKIYIGQTSNISRRFSQHKMNNNSKFSLIKKSIDKYGWESFKKEILYEFNLKSDCDSKEIELINLYKKQNISLNIATGGEGGTIKPIIQFDLDGNIIKRWESAEMASKEIAKITKARNIPYILRAAASGCKKGISNYYMGYLWLYEEDFIQDKIPIRTPIFKKILQFDLQGNYIKTFENFNQIKNQYNCSYGAISLCISGKNKTLKGFTYLYEEDYKKGKKPYILKRKIRISKEKVLKIKTLLKNNITISEISRIENSSRNTIRQIRDNEIKLENYE